MIEASPISPSNPERRSEPKAYLAHMRHELRTPLNAMLGYSEMLMEDAVDSGMDSWAGGFRVIQTTSQHLLSLVNDILNPLKIEGSRETLNLEALGAELDRRLGPPHATVIARSHTLLAQAEEQGQTGFIADLRKIYTAAERFMSLVREIGEFSSIRAGTDNAGMVPAVEAADPETVEAVEAENDESTGVPAGPGGRSSLLIVDDNQMNRDVLSRRLERQGHVVSVAENGEIALEMLDAGKFDLVLLDILMPGLNGYEILEKMKADPALRNIPVIMISALDDLDSVVRCIEMGAEDYLPKPFNPTLLKARIGACLEKKRLRDQELEYLRDVDRVTAAAAAVEAGTFVPETLSVVALRQDKLGQMARVFQRMGQEVRAREENLQLLNQAASRFVPQEYLGFLRKESIFDINLGDYVSNEMTVMFSDLRSFTSLSETMTPRENFDFVNAYLGRVSPVVREFHGFIVKYLGDGIMAIFPGCADDAVRAGVEKLKQVARYNEYRRSKRRVPIGVGIGVNTGHMMVGMVGETHRMQGDAFSDDVNLTSRLEGLTKHYQVSFIISAATRSALADPKRYRIRFLDKVQVQGKEQALELYEVFDTDPPQQRDLKQETQSEFEEALRLYYAREFADAQAKLFSVLQRNPKDKVAWRHLVQATKLAEQDPEEGWTGITRMTEK